ncbi:DNA glycosylase [Neoconidiobolus thromboides FSU 785]|nr:DNA glycosylase [Neoconidiobolus thromboides FSU 785]
MKLRSHSKIKTEIEPTIKKEIDIDSSMTITSPEEKPKKVKKAATKKVLITSGPFLSHKPPSNWESTFLKIRKYRETHSAPVDSMGCERGDDEKLTGKEFRFHVLISLILSSQTRDEDTYLAMKKLRQACGKPLTPQLLVDMDEEKLHQCITKVGFHNLKWKYIKRTARICLEEYDNDIPDNLEELLKLPGVGPKMAFLALQCGWNYNIGIGVDTHVHRISNRLGWVKTKEPEQTRVALENVLPKKYWKEINFLLVGFGQTVCIGNRPRCFECPVAEDCPSFDKTSKLGKRGNVRSAMRPKLETGEPEIKIELEEKEDSLSFERLNNKATKVKKEESPETETASKYFKKE